MTGNASFDRAQQQYDNQMPPDGSGEAGERWEEEQERRADQERDEKATAVWA
jgi:hypothetical protein